MHINFRCITTNRSEVIGVIRVVSMTGKKKSSKRFELDELCSEVRLYTTKSSILLYIYLVFLLPACMVRFSSSWYDFNVATKGGVRDFPPFFLDSCVVYGVFVLCSTSRVRASMMTFHRHQIKGIPRSKYK